MQNKVELCGVNTAKLKVLKNEETQALLRRAKAGDRQAREELIAGNLRLVLSVIHKFSNRGENVDDLFQVGCIGLIKAIDNFQHRPGCALLHLWRTDDRGERSAGISGTTARCGYPAPCGTPPIKCSRPRGGLSGQAPKGAYGGRDRPDPGHQA